MPTNQPTTNIELSNRIHREHYSNSNINLSNSILASRYGRLDNNDKYLRKERNKSYKCSESSKSCFACESDKRIESNFQHICPNNPILTCNCSDSKFCAELPNDNGWIKCPESGKICSIIDCPSGCKGDSADKSEQQNKVYGCPCVVIGNYCETSSDSA